MTKKIVLVTGAAGFIGFHVSQALLDRGDEVIGVDNINDYYDPGLKRTRLKILKKYKNFSFKKLDIADYKQLEKIFKKHKLTHVCSLAAQAGVRYSLEDPFAYERSNNLGFLNILELCRHNEVKNIIFASSSSVYGGNEKVPFSEKDNVDKPISVYAATKKYNEVLAHAYHHLYDLNCTGLRFFTVYGPYGRPDLSLFKFTKNILENKPIDVYNYGNHRRDFTYITDIVAGILAAIDKSYPYEIFNLGCSNTVKLMDFIKIIEKELGREAKKNMLGMQPGDVEATYADITKAKKMLGFKPKVLIEEGTKKFIDWYREYYKV